MLLGVLCSREVPRAFLPAKVVHDLSNEERLGKLCMQTAVLEPGKVREADQQKRASGRKSAAISVCGPPNARDFLLRLCQRSLADERRKLFHTLQLQLYLSGLNHGLAKSRRGLAMSTG